MRLKSLFMMVLLTIAGKTLADDNLSVADVSLNAGGSKAVSINLVLSSETYSAMQFDIVLPKGITVPLRNNKLQIALTNDHRQYDDFAEEYSHSLASSQTASDENSTTYRVVIYDANQTMLKEGSGSIVRVNITADENAGGDMTAYVKNIMVAASGGSGGVTGGKALSNATFTITVAGKPTVTAENKTREYGDENPELTYTVSGGTITGTPTLSTTATQESAVGDYPITVTPSNDYNVANGTLTVTKAPLTISGGTYTIKQGEALPTFAAEYSGFKNNETSSVLTSQPTLTLAEGVTGASEPGNYDITVAGATADNYEITFQKGTLTVAAADPVTVTATSYTINYGDALPDFAYTSTGATLAGTPEITCTATTSSPVGTYPIIITKGSVTNYNDTYVNGTLTITAAPLTIKAGSYTMKQGQTLPTFTASYEGFKNGETEEVLKKQPVLACEATAASAPGTYEVTVSGAEAQNYEISYVPGTLTVTAADPVTVTATSYTINYGDALPDFAYTSTGATLAGTPEITCTATTSSPVGTYPIIITKGSVTNYNDTYVNGTLTISAAPLTIKAGSYTMKQGQALPTFTASYEGFKNGETEDVLTTKPTITTTATSASTPGTYEVTASGAEAQNYEISYVPGTLTVTAADPVTVTATSYTINYGDALPDFGYTSTGATLSGTPEITCTATTSSPVGTYPIIITKGSVTNYNDTYVNGTLTITAAPLTIKAGSYTMKQGQALPTFTASYEGFKNGETEEVLTTKPTITTTATSASTPGIYDVTASGAEAQNYEISYVPGTLTVELLKGDVTGDGLLNADDLTALVNYILGKGTLANVAAAYVNDDTKIDIQDVAALIGIIKDM